MSSTTIITGATILTIYHGAPGRDGTSSGGDVVGPSSSVNNELVAFNGTTGKLIKGTGQTIAGISALFSTEATARINGDASTLAAANAYTDSAISDSVGLTFKRDEFTNSTGNQNINPAFGTKLYEVVLTVANGSAREIFVYLGNTGSMEAALIWVKVKLPAVAGFVIKFAAASAPLVVLDQTTSDASGRAFSVTFRGKLSDNSWEKIAAAYPIS